MSRYYDLTITPIGGFAPIRRWTSEPSPGVFDPQAQNIDFDLLAYDYSTPTGASTVSIEGIGIGDIGQATSFTGMTLQIKGGMKAGLPLAQPNQSGILLTGQVWQSFGNWEGTEMTLDFVILSSGYTFDSPGNFVLYIPKGQQLSQGIHRMLAGAFPINTNLIVNISPNRVLSHTACAYYHSFEQAASAIKDLTAGQFGVMDPGITMTFRGDGSIFVFDGTQANKPVKLDLEDFIGQPVWINPLSIQMKLVMRADMSVGSTLVMPAQYKNVGGIVTTTQSSLPSYNKYSSVFQGNFSVTSLRHLGSFRSPQGANWVTIVNAVSILP